MLDYRQKTFPFRIRRLGTSCPILNETNLSHAIVLFTPKHRKIPSVTAPAALGASRTQSEQRSQCSSDSPLQREKGGYSARRSRYLVLHLLLRIHFSYHSQGFDVVGNIRNWLQTPSQTNSGVPRKHGQDVSNYSPQKSAYSHNLPNSWPFFLRLNAVTIICSITNIGYVNFSAL